MKYLLFIFACLLFLTSCVTGESNDPDKQKAKEMVDEFGFEGSILAVIEAAYLQGVIDGERNVDIDIENKTFTWAESPWDDGTSPILDQGYVDRFDLISWDDEDRERKKKERKEN